MKQRLAIPILLSILLGVMIAVPTSALSNRDQAQAHYQRGDELSDSGKYEEAVDEFRKAIRLNPSHFESHNNLGFAFSRLGRYWEAVHEYKEAVRVHPDNAVARNNLGFMYNKLGLYEEAITAFEEAIRIDPKLEYPYSNLAYAYDSLKDGTKALAYVDQWEKLAIENGNIDQLRRATEFSIELKEKYNRNGDELVRSP